MLRNHTFDDLVENLIDTDPPPAGRFLHPLAVVASAAHPTLLIPRCEW